MIALYVECLGEERELIAHVVFQLALKLLILIILEIEILVEVTYAVLNAFQMHTNSILKMILTPQGEDFDSYPYTE